MAAGAGYPPPVVMARLTLLLLAIVAVSALPAGSQTDLQRARTLHVAVGGSERAPCTASAPCRTLDRANQLAAPGDTVLIRGGDYPTQVLRPDRTPPGETKKVIFRPAPGAKVRIVQGNGELAIRASNVEFRDLTVDDWYVKGGARNVTLRRIHARCCFFIDAATNVTVLGGSAGPADNLSNQISAYDERTGGHTTAPRNIVIDGMTIHDYRRTDGSAHVDCLHVLAADGLVVRNSRFRNCEHFAILFTVYGDAGSPRRVTIENNFLDCCRSGYYSIQLGGGHGEVWRDYLIRNNSTNKPMTVDADSTVAGNVRFFSNIAPSLHPSVCARDGIVADFNVWQSGRRCGKHDRIAPHGFLDAAKLDFRLRPTAAAVDRGNPASSPARDIQGDRRPRGKAPDAGADEVR